MRIFHLEPLGDICISRHICGITVLRCVGMDVCGGGEPGEYLNKYWAVDVKYVILLLSQTFLSRYSLE